jgi:EamA domain-containing membrane protein RarD
MSIKYQKVDSYFYFYLLAITFSSIASQYIFKKSYANANTNTNANTNANANTNTNILVVLGLCAYTFTGFCVYKILNYGNLVVLNIIWHLVYFIILFIIGFLIFNEKINYQKLVALLFGLISLIIFMFYGIE